MAIDIGQIFSDHPRLVGLAALTVVLAGIGTWYVVRHHLKLILLTVLCGFGFFSGCLVIYRSNGDHVLVGVGLFLLVSFPLIWLRALQSLQAMSQAIGAHPQPLATYDFEIRAKPPKGANDVAPKATKPTVAMVARIKETLVAISWAIAAKFQNRSAK